jgi:hypothetical protein
MMSDEEREQPCDEATKWRAQIELPGDMVDGFREWWDSEGWWSFRAWHERTFSTNSEWEQFMRRLCGEPELVKRPAVSSTDPKRS